ncbi:Serine/threonine-protein kinase HT1 [Leucoagaricus sp. SymC.cos]|nr:Serine/threonine-protein kinase HT1 [Leucoagaricus sp. SymC.cos]
MLESKRTKAVEYPTEPPPNSPVISDIDTHISRRLNDRDNKTLKCFLAPSDIATTAVARLFKCAVAEGRLGGAFFFPKKNQTAESDIPSAFTTIAYQLTQKSSVYKKHILDAIAKDPLILDFEHRIQFRKLIDEPSTFDFGREPEKRLVIIIGGLDRCDNDKQLQILNIIGEYVKFTSSPPLMWFVFARDEPHLKRVVKESRHFKELSFSDVESESSLVQGGGAVPSTPRNKARAWILDHVGYSTALDRNAPGAQRLASVRERLSAVKGSDAQVVIDFLDELLRTEKLEDNQRKRTLDLLRKMVQSAETIPECLLLSDDKFDLSPFNAVASGGFSDIHKIKYSGIYVGVKVVRIADASKRGRLLRAYAGELVISAHITHNNILPFYGFIRFGESPLFAGVFKWLEYGNVKDYLRKNPETPRIPLVSDIISGLDYLHGINIIHTDLKAKKVLISNEGCALLADFGISRVVATVATWTSYTGSINWMAPEILAAEDDILAQNAESDIWSLACTCYEIVTGHVPFYEIDPSVLRQADLDASSQELSFPNVKPEPLLGQSLGQGSIIDPFTPRDHARSWILELVGYSATFNRNTSEAQALANVRERLSALKGSDAQHVIDFLDELLRTENLKGDKQRRTLDLLHKIVKSAQIVPQHLLLSDVVLKFDPLELVAAGGFSDIFKREYKNRVVAVKVVRIKNPLERDKVLKRHTGELIISAYLAHPNILPFYGVVKINDSPLLIGISEWMENGDLLNYLEKKPEVPRIPLIADIVSGLDYLHGMDIIHADLNATNMLISDNGHALLADFSASRVMVTGVTSSSDWMTVVNWIAPEILTAEDDILAPNAESDIWSLACTCYEIVTGHIPFYEIDLRRVNTRLPVAMKTRKVVPTLPDTIVVHDKSNEATLAAKIRDLLMRCWNYTPAERPSIAEIKSLISRLNYTDDRAPLQSTDSTNIRNMQTSSSITIDYDRVYSVFRQVGLAAVSL